MNTKALKASLRADTGAAAAWLPLIAIFAFGLVLRNFVVANTDVSWLITLCEKVLSGETPYADFVEVNPPASIWLYILPVALARALSLRPEIVVDAFVFLGAAGSLWLSAAIAKSAALFERRTIFHLAALFAAVFVLLPAQNFGEREHIALMTFLPLLALSAVRAENKKIAPGFIIAAGVGAGVTAIIKPHFVFAIVFVALLAALHAKYWRTFLALENWIAGAMLAAYGMIVYVAYPDFVAQTLPLVAEIYVPVRASLLKFLVHFATPIFLLVLAAIWMLKGRTALRAPFSLLLAASFGFAISYYGQLKGWSYHSYPMLALALVAAIVAFAQRWPLNGANEAGGERLKRLASALLIALLAGATFIWMNFSVDMRAARDVIMKSAPRPSVIAITSDIAIGHPLTRAVNGTWVGRVCSQWVTVGARLLKLETDDQAKRARYDALEAFDRDLLLEDIRRAKPDIILVDRIRFDWLKWAQDDARIARELENYRPLDTVNDVMILRRK